MVQQTRYITLLLLGLLLLSLTSAAQETWVKKELSSCELYFPEQPEEDRDIRAHRVKYTYKLKLSKNRSFHFSCLIYSQHMQGGSASLVINNFLQRTNSQEKEISTFEINGIQGTQLISEDNTYIYTFRVIFDKNIAYNIWSVMPKNNLDETMTMQFLNSLKLKNDKQ